MKYLSPFAPDISGAVSVLFGMGGAVVILDAGGCTGNACGFDEPRWFDEKSAVFSAGLRDLDAILGRDEAMLDKTAEVLKAFRANFLAIIGTPVPAVIGTDFHGLKKEAERRFGIPVLAIDTNGMELYDRGASKAYLELVRLADRADADGRAKDDAGDFRDAGGEKADAVLVFGCTPLDLAPGDTADALRERLRGQYGGKEILIAGEQFGDLKRYQKTAQSVVVAPSGMAAAEEARRRWNIPYRVGYPVAGLPKEAGGGKSLIIHQAVYADSLRRAMEDGKDETADIATFFDLPESLAGHGDVRLKEEEDFLSLVRERAYDRIYADPLLARACPDRGSFIPLPHFAVSGNAAQYEAGNV